jgi:hypothetical protein
MRLQPASTRRTSETVLQVMTNEKDNEFLQSIGIEPVAPEDVMTEDEKKLFEMQWLMILARS